MADTPVLNLLETPLQGIRLIEASAGTGKTYTIAGLFVRLVVEQRLTVDRILVVTYTRAATEELKSRIRARLAEALEAFFAGTSRDPFLGALVERTADPGRACRCLEQAVRDFDRACIFTIHGFCQRLLAEHAFETRAPFEFELVPDPANLRREVAEDYWRRHFYRAPAELVAFAAQKAGVSGPEHYRKRIDRPSLANLKVVPEPGPAALGSLEDYRHTYRQLAAAWPTARSEVLERLCDPALNGRVYGKTPDKRAVVVAALAEAMDRFTAGGRVGFPLFDNFGKFTAEGLQSATRKRQRTPHHRFFERCQQLKGLSDRLSLEIQSCLLDLDVRFFAFAETELKRRKQAENILFYDDLLLAVRNALSADSDRLSAAVRSRFHAALVDEFQDTDSIQCDIFLQLFSAPDALLYMIGDPKQSIYSFRGSDIFSYLQAARKARQTYTLRQNWRSEPALIRAFNALFSQARHPFVYPAIGYDAANPGREPSAATISGPAMHLWYFPGQPKGPLNKSDAEQRVTTAVADEIVRRVSASNEAGHPGEVAVLVRTNRQGRRMKDALDARRIPAVLYGAGSVFDSREAAELQRLLAGICEHNREDRFRSAVITDMLGTRASQLEGAEAESSAWEARRSRFREYAALWQQRGFMPMFRLFLVRERVRERLLGFIDGERRLTNLFHLAELLQEESLQRPPSMMGLIRWLADQRSETALRREEQLLRLESDARAVNILTIHRSKGLEFPIVFCPFTWEGSLLRAADDVVCHDPESAERILDLGSERIETHRRLAQTETLAENLRLFYVAVTRARKQCYLVWGRFNTAETSAPAYLFHGSPALPGEADVVAALQARVTAMDDDARLRDLNQLAARSGAAIALTVQPHPASPQHAAPDTATDALACPQFRGQIDRSWKVTSYSALVSQRRAEEDRPDYDLALTAPPPEETPAVEEPESASAERRIEDFPRGARAGIFFHDLLQQIPFGRTIGDEMIHAKLQEYNFDAGWQSCVKDLLERVLAAELQPGLRLRSINRQHRVAEMEFYVPLQPLAPGDLQAIYRDIGVDIPNSYSVQMDSLEFSPVRGFLKGYIDLIFEHDDRYYLLDWKSNYLGDGRRFYRPAALAEIMTAERYVLQYLLYTVAADRYLRSRHCGYRYEEHFGGVFYLFLRGISAAATDRSGIYFDRPPPEAIEALGNALIGA